MFIKNYDKLSRLVTTLAINRITDWDWQKNVRQETARYGATTHRTDQIDQINGSRGAILQSTRNFGREEGLQGYSEQEYGDYGVLLACWSSKKAYDKRTLVQYGVTRARDCRSSLEKHQKEKHQVAHIPRICAVFDRQWSLSNICCRHRSIGCYGNIYQKNHKKLENRQGFHQDGNF